MEAITWHQLFDRFTSEIDLLKCDCEGGEKWLLEDRGLLSNVKILVMAYHISDVSEDWAIGQHRAAGFRILSKTSGPFSRHIVAKRC